MKSSAMKRSRVMAAWIGMLAGLAALLVWAGPATAGEKVTVQAVAYTISFEPGAVTVAPSGNIHMRGLRAVNMVLSENPVVTGRLTVVGNWNGDAEMNGVGSGTSTFEVGTWDLSSGAPVFIPSATGGLFVASWEAKGNLAGSHTIQAVGHGLAGEVEGMAYSVEANAPDALSALYTGWLLDSHAKK